MASGGVRLAVLRLKLTCSICLELFCSPVTLPCAHSFCRGCIQTCWDKWDISCPLCLTRFPQRPALSVNLIMESLASDLHPCPPERILQNFFDGLLEKARIAQIRALQPDDDEEVTQNKVMCSQHKEDELSLFCLQDNTLMCEKCAAQHKTHSTVPAVEQIPQIKKMLRNEKIPTTNSTHNVKVDILKAQMNMETFKESSKFQKEELEVDFSRLITTINDVEGRLMASMDEKEKKLLQNTESQVAKMEATCRSLENKMSNIDAGMKSTDPCVVLQAYSSLQSSLSHASKLQSSDDAALDPEEKLTESSDIREQLITAVTAIWKESKFRWTWTVVAKALDIDFFTSTSVKLSELDRFKEFLTFDLTTAGCFIWVSLDKTMAMNSYPIKQPYETTLGRLSSHYVRASQSFTGGRHFWRVSFSKRPAYFGMKSDDMSWCVEIETDQEIKVICSSEKSEAKYDKCSNYTSFGVYLDYESGILCLYGLRVDSADLLYSFITSFGKRVLFPVFKVADNTHVKLS